MDKKLFFGLLLALYIQNSYGKCYIPICDSAYERETLFAHDDVLKFWQCEPKHGITWGPTERPCANTTWFCNKYQVCIWPEDWNEKDCGCGDGGAPPTNIPTNTPDITTSSTDKPTEITDDESSTPAPGKCYVPVCDTKYEREKLWPHDQADKFWQCEPKHGITWGATERPCAPGTWFCDKEQVCIWPENWTHSECGCGEGATESPAPGSCYIPTCNTVDERDRLWPHEKVSKFWQCKSGPVNGWEPVEMSCAKDVWFCKKEQACIHPEGWTHTDCGCCDDDIPPSTSTTTSTTPKPTPKPTTPTTTPTSTTTPGPIICELVPNCIKENLLTLWPHINSVTYWACELIATPEGGVWDRVQRHCNVDPNGTQLKFSFYGQKCVHPSEWSDVCEDPTDPGLCGEPRCVEQELSTKFPHRNPRNWYACTAIGKSEVHTCPQHHLFGFKQQKCVSAEDCEWTDPCGEDIPLENVEPDDLFD